MNNVANYTPVHATPRLYRNSLRDARGAFNPAPRTQKKKTKGKVIISRDSPVRQIKKTLIGFIKSLFFAGGYSMLVRRTICFLTQVYSYNNVISLLSGFSGGITLVFQPKSRQAQIGLYTLNKSMQVLYNMAVRRNWKVRIPYGECWLMAVAMSIICFTYMQDSLLWRQNYRKVLDKMIGSI